MVHTSFVLLRIQKLAKKQQNEPFMTAMTGYENTGSSFIWHQHKGNG